MNVFRKTKLLLTRAKKIVLNTEYIKDFKRFMTATSIDDAGYKYVQQNDLKKAITPSLKIGLTGMAIGLFLFVVWGGLAPLDSAAIAEGVVTLSDKKKTIQHLEGGIIDKIEVIEGQEVKAGTLLIELNSAAAKARLQVIDGQLIYIEATEVRLKAEQENASELIFNSEKFDMNNPDVVKIIQSQKNLFNVRKAVSNGQVNVLNERIAQYEQQIVGLEVKLKSTQSQKQSLEEELANTEALFKKGLALKPRVLEIKRQLDSAVGAVADIQSNIFGAKEAASEAKLQILNVDNEFQKEVASEFKENHNHLLELTEQYNAAIDVLNRTKIISPYDGIITDLQYHTVGGVISPGAKILDVIPQDDKLIVEAKVRPQDIDSLYVGLTAKVQLSAYKSRLVPRLDGRVTYISADIVQDPQTGMAFYITRVEIDQRQLNDLNIDIKLYPGMPASVFIVKGTRTFLQYMLSPIRDSFFRAFKES